MCIQITSSLWIISVTPTTATCISTAPLWIQDDQNNSGDSSATAQGMDQELDIEPEEATYFLSRITLQRGPGSRHAALAQEVCSLASPTNGGQARPTNFQFARRPNWSSWAFTSML